MKRREKPGRTRPRPAHAARPAPSSRVRSGAPSIADLADTLVRGGREVLALDDPLEVEAWASAMLGTFYKLDAPLEARDALEQQLWPTVITKAESRGDVVGIAVLRALAAVADDEIKAGAQAAADRLRAAGVADPPWAPGLGTVAFEGAWAMHDVFGDQEGFFASFRYQGDVRQRVDRSDGVFAVDAEPGAMARRIIDGIANGDTYIDNDWTPEFKQSRALVLARMRRLPIAPPAEPREPPTEKSRAAIVAEFLAGPGLPNRDEVEIIAAHCLGYLCDYLGDDPFRWSPIVVEQYMLDYLPRKVSLTLATIAVVPAVLQAWVRFALIRRGLDERWIVETEAAVEHNAKEFRRAMTEAGQFGPAKHIGNAMLADGVDLLDQESVDRWIRAYNARPFSERGE